MSGQRSLNERLSFMKMDRSLMRRLRGLKTILMAAMPTALDAFYGQIQADPATKGFFKSQSMVEGARKLQRSHWDRIADGEPDQAYVEAATKVGNVHARIGLEPGIYIGGYGLLLDNMVSAVLKARLLKRKFWQRAPEPAELAADISALFKAALLDMDIVISVYLQSSEAARVAAEQKAAAASAALMKTLGDAMGALAAGDLTYRIGNSLPAEYARLGTDFNSALEHFASTIASVQLAARVINTSIDEIAVASDDLARRTEQQAANLLETSTALTELTDAVKRTASGASQANVAVGAANSGALNSRGVVVAAGTAMGQIEASSQEISQIIGLIDDIAFQTNLLALNAGVEAARAGDAGRGFAVVASEVRALAQRSAEAAKAIKTLISNSSAQVAQGVDLVGKTREALEAIGGNVAQIEQLVSGISASAQSQASGLNQVSEAVHQMTNVVQQNAAMVEESTAATHSLKMEIEELSRSISSFKLGQEANPMSRGHAAVAARRLELVK